MIPSNSLALKSTSLSLAARESHELVQGSSIHSFTKYLLTDYYINKTNSHCLTELIIGGGNTHTHTHILTVNCVKCREVTPLSLGWSGMAP